MKLKAILFMLGMSSLLSGCAAAPTSRLGKPFRMNGMVYDGDSKPVASVRIRIDEERTATSDVNGRFFLFGLEPGEYSVSAMKEGFESIHVKLDYSGPNQILYIKLHSAEQLLAMAEKAIEKRNWKDSRVLLQRTQAIAPADISARFLAAVLFYRTGEYEKSKNELEGILADGGDEPFVHLFLADLLQYIFEKPEAALKHLEKFRSYRNDPDSEKRSIELKSMTDMRETTCVSRSPGETLR